MRIDHSYKGTNWIYMIWENTHHEDHLSSTYLCSISRHVSEDICLKCRVVLHPWRWFFIYYLHIYLRGTPTCLVPMISFSFASQPSPMEFSMSLMSWFHECRMLSLWRLQWCWSVEFGSSLLILICFHLRLMIAFGLMNGVLTGNYVERKKNLAVWRAMGADLMFLCRRAGKANLA